MDEIARLADADRNDLFTTVARNRTLPKAIIEKDFWVCWCLKRVFTLSEPPAGLLFKGGTSLSKVFNAIERFSEDVDLSFDRAGLGFGAAHDPAQAVSRKKQLQGIKGLKDKCQTVIREQFVPQLASSFDEALGKVHARRWSLLIAPDDPDQQTVVFQYPSTDGPGASAGYLKPEVRLEMGARSDHWPSVSGTVTSYAAEELPGLFKEKSCTVKVLDISRTFWEKATLLHMLFHIAEGKSFPERHSRHYYDTARVYEKGLVNNAMTDTSLLLHVAKHKDIFFHAAWAKYDLAKPGTLRLLPPKNRARAIELDYEKMQEMIFGTPPSFNHVLTVLGEIEAKINKHV